MSERKIWPALDVLRGFAVICMLVNHAAVYWLQPDIASLGLAGVLNFLGSFAPVLFFFTTGLGYGLAHQVGRYVNWPDVLIKASILIVADIFMRGGDFTLFGWDFLAFIGFSMLFLSLLRGRRFAIIIAVLIMGLLFLVRYFLGAESIFNQFFSDAASNEWMLSVVGRTPFNNISYWFTPWLIYPLAGFVIGAWAKRFAYFIDRQTLLVSLMLLVIGIVSGVLSYLLLQKGMILFRWGTMSINFFIASIAMVAVSLSLAWFISDVIKQSSLSRTLVDLIAMRGVSSLAVVPIHYFFLHLLGPYLNTELTQAMYLVALCIWLPFCFILARYTDQVTRRVALLQISRLPLVLSICILAFAIFTTLSSFSFNFIVVFVAQILLCIMLGFSYSTRRA